MSASCGALERLGVKSEACRVDALDVTHPRSLFLGLALCSAGACTTTRELSLANGDEAVVQRLAPERAWRVQAGETLLGYVVRFDDPRLPGRCSYSVRNELQQELGTIDELGRAWRFVPHQREAQWVCTSTLKRDVSALFEARGDVSLEEVSVDRLRAGQAGR